MIPLFYLLTWKSALEISVISSIIYYSLRWLATDKTKSVLLYFYSYCACAAVACFLQLPTLINFLLWIFPLICVIIVLLHAQVLQRNFVALKKIAHPESRSPVNWIDELVRACLNTRNQGLTNYFVIEHTDALDPFVEVRCPINAQLHQELIAIIMHTQHPQNSFILLDSTGKLIGCRCSWKTDFDVNNGAATWFTDKLDCLVLISNEKGFSLIHSAKIIDQLTGPQVCTILKHIVLSTSSVLKKGSDHDPIISTVYKKSPEQQSHS